METSTNGELKNHGYTCVPHPEPFSLLPPHTIPLGRPNLWRIHFDIWQI